jgi:hypothetical protein
MRFVRFTVDCDLVGLLGGGTPRFSQYFGLRKGYLATENVPIEIVALFSKSDFLRRGKSTDFCRNSQPITK